MEEKRKICQSESVFLTQEQNLEHKIFQTIIIVTTT